MEKQDSERQKPAPAIEQVSITDLSNEEPGIAQQEKALVRRIDVLVMPILWLMYLFSYADRTNIANAKVAGMMQELRLSSDQYSLAIVIFFIPYVLFQVPSNLILVKTRPSVYLSSVMTIWGVVTCCTSAVQSYGSLLAVRFVLGALEASFAPGVSLLLSSWYKRAEQAKRFSIFYSAAVFSGAFGGIVAGAITGRLNSAHGITAWRWLFIVEGSATMACAILSAFILPDFPTTSKRLSEHERRLAIDRLLCDDVLPGIEDGRPTGSIQAVIDSLKNWRTWLFTVGYVVIGGSATMSYFYPTLVAGLGYTSHMAQYMIIPIYGVALVAVVVTGWLNDVVPIYRGLAIAGCLAIAMGCSIAICAVYNFTARYVLLIFMASALLASNPLSLAFASSTFGTIPPETRGVSLALINAIANLSQIYGAYLFPSYDAPKYLMAFAVISGLCAVGIAIYSTLHFLLRKYPLSR